MKRRNFALQIYKLKLSQSTTKLRNLLDATQGWRKVVTDENELQGLSENAKKNLPKKLLQQHQVEGWFILLWI